MSGVRFRGNSLGAILWLTFAILGGLMLAGCGSPFHTTDRVVSVTGTRVCVTRTDGVVKEDGSPWISCFALSRLDTDRPLEVGNCLELKRAGESADVLSGHPTACPA